MEWRAWHRIVLELDKLGLDMNAEQCTALVETIKDWGEWRSQQHRDQDYRWLAPPDFDTDAVAEAIMMRDARRGT